MDSLSPQNWHFRSPFHPLRHKLSFVNMLFCKTNHKNTLIFNGSFTFHINLYGKLLLCSFKALQKDLIEKVPCVFRSHVLDHSALPLHNPLKVYPIRSRFPPEHSSKSDATKAITKNLGNSYIFTKCEIVQFGIFVGQWNIQQPNILLESCSFSITHNILKKLMKHFLCFHNI